MKNDKEELKEIQLFLENQLERTNNWLNFAEAKNAGAVALDGAIVIGLIAMFDKTPIFCSVIGCTMLVALIIGFISFIPNMNKLTKKRQIYLSDESYNLIFYGDIANISSSKEYLMLIQKKYFPEDKGNDIVRDGRMKDFADEIIINSRIASAKYKCFGWIVKVNVLAFLMCIAMFVIA